jgi:hypothetical protein
VATGESVTPLLDGDGSHAAAGLVVIALRA